jgi:hypothetical protein
MSHRDWNIQVHQRLLEPVDDVVNQLIKQYGPISPTAEAEKYGSIRRLRYCFGEGRGSWRVREYLPRYHFVC